MSLCQYIIPTCEKCKAGVHSEWSFCPRCGYCLRAKLESEHITVKAAVSETCTAAATAPIRKKRRKAKQVIPDSESPPTASSETLYSASSSSETAKSRSSPPPQPPASIDCKKSDDRNDDIDKDKIVCQPCTSCSGSTIKKNCRVCRGIGSVLTAGVDHRCNQCDDNGDSNCKKCHGYRVSIPARYCVTAACRNCIAGKTRQRSGSSNSCYSSRCELCGGSGKLLIFNEKVKCVSCRNTGTDSQTGQICQSCLGSGWGFVWREQEQEQKQIKRER
mmetsp:Transcript_56108/g.93511  ORF Transcript_56108/g.93511 Transcript_56108/m.93511 type:complete len:275 (-) Transcript_56108:62-886(-)